MASLKACRTVTVALLLVMLATTAIPAAASTRPPDDQARYCKSVDAYRIKSCAEALLPDSPLGRQLRWVLDQLAGEAATLTEAEVRAHFSPNSSRSGGGDVARGDRRAVPADHCRARDLHLRRLRLPTRVRQALALVQSATGEWGAVPIGVTRSRPALIGFFAMDDAPPTIVPRGRYSGWFDIGGRRLFLLHRPPQSHRGVRGRADHRLVPAAEPAVWVHPGVQLRPSQRPLESQRPRPHPRTARDVVADLHALLRTAHVPGPYVLAGHSNGGLFTQLYASTHPRQVAGLVLIDAVHAAYHKRTLAMLKPLVPPEVGSRSPRHHDPGPPAAGPRAGRHLDQ